MSVIALAAATFGALFALASAFTNAGAVVQTRRLTDTETTSSIVLYVSLFCDNLTDSHPS